MNDDVPHDHVSLHYYDSDYPSGHFGKRPENFDATTAMQGLAHDVEAYLGIAGPAPRRILEACCGTGRVAIPLAERGHLVTGFDISRAYLDRFRENLATRPPETQARVRLVQQDATRLDLGGDRFDLVLFPFNSLSCIPELAGQLRALERAAAHLAPEGRVVVDVVNPLRLNPEGDPVPKPFFTRRNVHTGNLYTRFAASSPFDERQVQALHGWYDETFPDGTLRRRPYRVLWRPTYRYELELMLERAGLVLEGVAGGHRGEPWQPSSPKIFAVARGRRPPG